MRRWFAPALAAAIVATGLLSGSAPLRAEGADSETRVRSILSVHCASCHGWLQAESRFRDGFAGSILDLEALARDSHLVVPGNPDSSRLYNSMLLRQMPPPAAAGQSHASPTAGDLAAVRRWIESLEPQPADCDPTASTAPATVARRIAEDLSTQPDVRRVRYLTIVSPALLCGNEETPGLIGAEVDAFMQRLKRGTRSLRVVPVTADATLFRVLLDELGWSGTFWDRVVARSAYRVAPRTLDYERLIGRTGSLLPYLRVDELAARLARDHAAAGGGPDVGRSLLSRGYERDVDIWAAAAELGIPRSVAPGELERAHGAVAGMGRRLAGGSVPRAAFEASYLDLVDQLVDARIITGPERRAERPAAASDVAVVPGTYDISVLADRAVYRQGELMSFVISTGRDCRLQVMNVGSDGQATLLFPNDFQRGRMFRAGEVLVLPGSAPYQFRADQPGRELLVAECLGETDNGLVRSNFSSQRFTRIGDYGDYLARRLALSPPKAGDAWRGRSAFVLEVR